MNTENNSNTGKGIIIIIMLLISMMIGCAEAFSINIPNDNKLTELPKGKKAKKAAKKYIKQLNRINRNK